MTRNWKFAGLLSLIGCSGGEPTVENAPVEQSSDCTALISWVSPTKREDGTPFSVEEIQQYDLFIGTESGVHYRIIGIEDAYLTSWEEFNLQGGDNYFAMTVTDSGGRESQMTDEIVKFIDNRCTGE